MIPRLIKPIHLLAVALLLGLHGWLAVSATANKSATWDEPLHLVGGYSYASKRDFRLHSENGALPQLWAGLSLRDLAPQLPDAGHEENWSRSRLNVLGGAFLYDVGNDSRAILATARRAAVLWSVLLGVAVFAWAYALWGVPAAFFALSLHAISPTFLAHGALVTSDVCGALFITLATWAWWRHLQRPTVGSLLVSALAAGLAAIAKFSSAVLPPLFILLAVWKLWSTPVWHVHLVRARELRGAVARLSWIGAAVAVHALVAALVIWTMFAFRFSPVGPGMPELVQYHAPWSYVFAEGRTLAGVLTRMSEWRLLPETYIYGFGFVLRFAESRPSFLNGEFGTSGWWWFFPYAFLIKSSIAELVAFGATIVLAIAAWRKRGSSAAQWLRERAEPVVPLVGLILVYLALSVTSELNIGHRHVLPLYPALFVLSGALVASADRWRRGLAVAILVVGSIESFAVRPHYLAFFNSTVGGPSQGWRHLVDSSLDWGQDLPALVDWLRTERRPDEPLYFNLFGQGRAVELGVTGTEIAPAYARAPRPWIEWGPGIYAVSATMLQNVYSPFAGPWDAQKETNFQVLSREGRAAWMKDPSVAYIGSDPTVGYNYWTLERLQFARLMNYLRLRTPDAVLGYTVFVHRLSEREVDILTRGESAAYFSLLESAM